MAGEQSFDESVTDPVQLAAMFAAMETGASQNPPDATANEEVKEPAKADPATDPAAAEQADDKKEPAGEPDGVATKDGKHIIPYSVLQADRERARRAEQALAERDAELAALKQGKPGEKDGTATIEPVKAPAADDLSEEDLADLKENFPTVYKGLMATKAAQEAIEARLKPVQDSVNAAEAARQLTVEEQVQEAIDATPKLAHLSAVGGEQFDLAKQFDNTLKANPAWSGKPLAERFAKVVELVEQASGQIAVPGAKVSLPAQKTAEQLRAEAMATAAAAATAGKTAVPTSLSDFPAGDHAATDEQQTLESMTTMQLQAKFAKFTPEQMDAYLNSL